MAKNSKQSGKIVLNKRKSGKSVKKLNKRKSVKEYRGQGR